MRAALGMSSILFRGETAEEGETFISRPEVNRRRWRRHTGTVQDLYLFIPISRVFGVFTMSTEAALTQPPDPVTSDPATVPMLPMQFEDVCFHDPAASLTTVACIRCHFDVPNTYWFVFVCDMLPMPFCLLFCQDSVANLTTFACIRGSSCVTCT